MPINKAYLREREARSDNATRDALNEAAAAGANALYILSTTAEGVNSHIDVVGNALICK